MAQPLEFAAGLLVLLAVGALRFNTPSWVRNTTTAARYVLGMGTYLVLPAALYAVLVHDAAIPAIFTTLLIITAFTWIPPLPSLERAIRRLVHRFMDTSREAEALAHHLFDADCNPSPDVMNEVSCSLRTRGCDLDESWLPIAEPARLVWLKTATMFHLVRRWQDERRYRRFLGETRHEFDALRQRFDQLSLKLSRTMHAVDTLGEALPPLAPSGSRRHTDSSGETSEVSMEAAVRSAITVVLSDVREDIALFLRSLCAFTARGILATARGERGRRLQVEHLGFVLPKKPASVVSRLVYTFCLFVIGLTTLLLLVPTPDGWRVWAARVPMIAVIHCVAIAVAVIPKKSFGFANTTLHGREPFAFFVLAGLTASLASIPIGLAFRTAQLGWNGAWTTYWNEWHWLLMPFVTASHTAFLGQDRRWASVSSERARRFRDGLVLGAGMGIALAVVRALLPTASGSVAEPIGITATVVGFGFGIGFAVGYCVPYAFRDATGGAGSPVEAGRPRARRRASIEHLVAARALPRRESP